MTTCAAAKKLSGQRRTIYEWIRAQRRTPVVCALLLLGAIAVAAPTRYFNEVLADNPIAYWRFNESAGATANDASGHGNTGTYSGGVTLGQPGLPPGAPGDTAALFDGRTGRGVVPNSQTLNPASITMEAKIRWDGRNDFQQRILEKSYFLQGPDIEHSQTQAQYGLSILPDGHVRVELRTGAAGADPICGTPNNVVCANSAATVAVGVETHVAATYDGKEVRIYINGLPDSVTPAVAAGPIEAVPLDPRNVPYDALGLGNQSVRNRPFRGLIDEIALFDHALSADRIQAHYRSQFEAKNFEYAVKFVCGVPRQPVVAPGTYFTAINVHNPQAETVAFRTKVAVALPSSSPGPEVKTLPEGPLGTISRFIPGRLGPDQAFEIDCPEILKIAKPHERFLKGFVVLQVPAEFDIVAVYTAAGSTGRVETMEIERVPARAQAPAAGKPDLIPVPDAKGSFCRGDNSKLTVTVKNQGAAPAGPSTTQVDFGASGIQTQPTPALAPGASVDLQFTIPPGCFHPDCGFKITVDSNNQVEESNELNNNANGVCIG